MNSKFNIVRLLTPLALAAGLVVFSNRAIQATPNSLRAGAQAPYAMNNSNQRHIVQNGYGYWAFVNQGNYFGVIYSSNAINWTVTPGHIMDPPYQDDLTQMVTNGDIYYDSVDSVVYAVTTDVFGTNTVGAAVFIASAALTSPGLPTWSVNKLNIDNKAGSGTEYHTQSEGEFSLTATVSNTGALGYLWFATTAMKDSAATRGILVSKINPATLTDMSDRGDAGTLSTNGTAYRPTIVQANLSNGGNGDVLVLYKRLLGNTTGWSLIGFRDVNSALGVSDTGPDINANGTAMATMGVEASELEKNNASCVWVSTDNAATSCGLVHCVAIDGQAAPTGQLRYRRYTWGNNAAANGSVTNPAADRITVDAVGSFAHPSIGLLGATSAYIVYEGTWTVAQNELYTQLVSKSLQNQGVAPKFTKSNFDNVDTGNSNWPTMPYRMDYPMPPRVVYSSNGVSEAYIDTIYLNGAPTINAANGVSPTTAPYNTNQFDLTINGTNFGDPLNHINYGTGVQVQLLYQGTQMLSPNAPVWIASTTYINGNSNQIRATVHVNNNLYSFCVTNATQSPHFDVKVINPDTQFVTYQSTFVISTVTVSSSYEDTYQHFLTTGTYDYYFQSVPYSNFESWQLVNNGSTVTLTTNPNDIQVASMTWVSQSSVRATIKIPTSGIYGGAHDLILTNPDGNQFTVSSTFTISSPTISSAYEDTKQHFLSYSTYDFVVNGSSFASWSGIPIKATFLDAHNGNPGVATNDLKVSSVSWNYTNSTPANTNLLHVTYSIARNVSGGPYTLQITNPYGFYVQDVSTFTISSPTITSSNEDSPKHYLSSSAYDYVINGSSFAAWGYAGSTVSVTFSNGLTSNDITVTSVTWNPTNSTPPNTNQIRASIVIHPGIVYDTYTITALDPYGLGVTLNANLSSTFTIPAPSMTSTYEDVNKHYLSLSTYDYIINGANFQEWLNVGSTVSISFTGGNANDITVTSVTYSNSGLLEDMAIVTLKWPESVYVVDVTVISVVAELA